MKTGASCGTHFENDALSRIILSDNYRLSLPAAMLGGSAELTTLIRDANRQESTNQYLSDIIMIVYLSDQKMFQNEAVNSNTTHVLCLPDLIRESHFLSQALKHCVGLLVLK